MGHAAALELEALDAEAPRSLSVAEAYGLGADEFGHILASFPVFARKRPAYYGWLLARVAEWRSGRGRPAVVYRPVVESPVRRVAEPPPQ